MAYSNGFAFVKSVAFRHRWPNTRGLWERGWLETWSLGNWVSHMYYECDLGGGRFHSGQIGVSKQQEIFDIRKELSPKEKLTNTAWRQWRHVKAKILWREHAGGQPSCRPTRRYVLSWNSGKGTREYYMEDSVIRCWIILHHGSHIDVHKRLWEIGSLLKGKKIIWEHQYVRYENVLLHKLPWKVQ